MAKRELCYYVDRALKQAGVPIQGVEIGDPLNRSTWVIHFDEAASPAQRAAAKNVLDAFVAPSDADEDAIAEVDAKILKAIVTELHAALPQPKPTLAQLRNNIIARYKAL